MLTNFWHNNMILSDVYNQENFNLLNDRGFNLSLHKQASITNENYKA